MKRLPGPLWPNFAFFWITVPVVYLYLKVDANIFDIWLFYYFADLVAKCLFPPILGSFFFFGGGGGWSPKCSRILSILPKKHIFGRKHAFWRIDRPGRSINATCAHAAESKKREKKKKRKKRNTELWQVTYLPRPPTLRYTHQNCHAGWGAGGILGMVTLRGGADRAISRKKL